MAKTKPRNGTAPRKLSFLSMSNFSFNGLQNGNNGGTQEEIGEEKSTFNEQKVGLALFLLTVLIICGKLYFALSKYFYN
jgi:hypothetical protein